MRMKANSDHLQYETQHTLATISSVYVTALYVANEGKQEGTRGRAGTKDEITF